jgi:hypothetical protein
VADPAGVDDRRMVVLVEKQQLAEVLVKLTVKDFGKMRSSPKKTRLTVVKIVVNALLVGLVDGCDASSRTGFKRSQLGYFRKRSQDAPIVLDSLLSPVRLPVSPSGRTVSH